MRQVGGAGSPQKEDNPLAFASASMATATLLFSARKRKQAKRC